MSEIVQGLVSIITPLYNGKNYIEETMTSVVNQTYENWEMIIVDDCSSDGSAEVVEKYIHDHQEQRIRLLHNRENLGVANTRNAGMKEAKGQYICFLDSDDLWKAKKLEHQISFLKEKQKMDSKAGFVFGTCEIINEDGISKGKIRKAKAQIDYKELLKDNGISCVSVMVDQTVIPKTLCFMPCIGHEDYATWLTILKNKYTAYGMEEVLCYYRISQNSISGNKKKAATWHYQVLKAQGISGFRLVYYMICYIYAAIEKRM